MVHLAKPNHRLTGGAAEHLVGHAAVTVAKEEGQQGQEEQTAPLSLIRTLFASGSTTAHPMRSPN
jgi:hypothetical protein